MQERLLLLIQPQGTLGRRRLLPVPVLLGFYATSVRGHVRGAVRGNTHGGGELLAEATGGPEAAGAAHALLQLGNLDNLGRVDALEHELGDAVALGDGEIGLGVVEEQDLDLATVVGVDDARAGIDEVSKELEVNNECLTKRQGGLQWGSRRGSFVGLTWRQGRSEGQCGHLEVEV